MGAGWGTGRGEVREHFQIRVHPTWLAFYFAHLAVEMFKGIAYHKKYNSYLLIQCHIILFLVWKNWKTMFPCSLAFIYNEWGIEASKRAKKSTQKNHKSTIKVACMTPTSVLKPFNIFVQQTYTNLSCYSHSFLFQSKSLGL